MNIPFYTRDTLLVARDLIGKQLVRVTSDGTVSGMIVETEAYGYKDDPASHAYRGQSVRNTPMFGPVGHAYVYVSYGVHACFNIVARAPEVEAGGVLIRSVVPIDGIDIMRRYRSNVPVKHLTDGPGKLTQAFAITKQDNKVNCMEGTSLYIGEYKNFHPNAILSTPRIGISKAADRAWRFIYRGV